jgi:hypothetical protein
MCVYCKGAPACDHERDACVRETSELGGCIAAERLGIPYAVVEVVAMGLGDERRSLLVGGLASVLAEHGLPPDPGLSMLERHAIVRMVADNAFPTRARLPIMGGTDFFPGDRTFAPSELIGHCVNAIDHRVGGGEGRIQNSSREAERSEPGVESRELIVTR